MTPRERIQAAFRHEETDRVPIDFGGHRSSGIAAIAYAKLKQRLGIRTGDIYVYDMVQQLAIVEPEVLDAVGADVVELGRAFLLARDGLEGLDAARWHALQDPGISACRAAWRRVVSVFARRQGAGRAEAGLPVLRADLLALAGQDS